MSEELKREIKFSNYSDKYTIVTMDNLTTIKSKDGSICTDINELKTLIDSIEYYIEKLQWGWSFDTFKSMSVIDTIGEMFCSGNAVWISNDIVLECTKNSLRIESQISPCVYFVQNPNWDDRIKIGFSTKIHQRLKTFYHDFGGVEPKVIAIAKSEYYIQLERLIHTSLSRYRIDGEWFDYKKVVEWLEDEQSFMEDYNRNE